MDKSGADLAAMSDREYWYTFQDTKKLYQALEEGLNRYNVSIVLDMISSILKEWDPCSGRSCDECEIGGCDHGREVV